MISTRLRALQAGLTALLAGCFTELPDVAPESLACEDDAPLSGGVLQCPASHWCLDLQCTPRLGCSAPDAPAVACAADVTRCELVANGEVAAVACESGLHTYTSTPADLGADCGCPDGLACVAYAEGPELPAGSYALFVFPPGAPAALPAGELKIASEREVARTCARPCSAELDCPAGHTCRPAAVLQDALRSDPSSTRHTIGVCFPDVITRGTLTSTSPEQPDRAACRSEPECTAALGRDGQCRAQAYVIEDHPSVPAGESAWGDRLAVIPRCVPEIQGLTNSGFGCDESRVCKTGVCYEGKCVDLCDPADDGVCFSGQRCADVAIEHTRPGGAAPIHDRLYICTD